MKLNLAEALRNGRVAEFADEADARLMELGFSPADEARVKRAIAKLARPPRSEDRTSHSSSDDGSSGT